LSAAVSSARSWRPAECDTASYLSFDPGWRPTLPSRSRGDFQIVDFLTFAGVDPKNRGL
jgi:hypothetical protein